MNLPVNPTQLDNRCFVHLNQPGSHAPFPQVPVPPRIGNNYAFVLYLLTLDVQQNAQRHPPRIFFSNLVSRNNWQNPEAQNLVATTFEVVDYMIATQQGNPQQIVEHAVAETVKMMVALTVSQYQEGLRQFLNQETGQAVNETLNQFQHLRNQIQQFMQYQAQGQNTGAQNWNAPPGNTGMVGGGTGWSGNNGNWSGNVGMAAPAAPMHNSSPLAIGPSLNKQYGQHKPASNLGWSAPSAAPAHPTGQGQIRVGPIRTQQPEQEWQTVTPDQMRNTHVVEISGGPAEPMVMRREEVAPQPERRINTTGAFGGRQFVDLGGPAEPPASVYSEVEATPTNQWEPPQSEQTTTQPLRGEGFTVTDPNNPYREIVYDDGSILREAETSGWTSDWSLKRPYHFAYNPRTHKLFHLRTNDGRVHEVLNERTEVMESYENHELNPELRDRERKRQAERGGKAVVDWTRMINLTPESSKPYALPSDEPTPHSEESSADQVAAALKNLPDMKVIDEVISAHDLLSAEAAAMTRHPELIKVAKTAPIEFYCEQVTPRLTVDNVQTVVEELAGSTTYAELRDALAKARTQHAEDGPIWDMIENRLTQQVNHLLNVSFAIEWKIGSFSDDILDLVKELENDYGPSVLDTFNTLTTHVIDQAICIAGKHVEDKLADDKVEGEASEDAETAKVEESNDAAIQHVIAFQNRSSITCIPYKFEDLEVAINGISAVNKQDLPELYAVIHAIFARTTDFPVSFIGRYIKTLDNVWLRLDLACLVDDAYLISRHTV